MLSDSCGQRESPYLDESLKHVSQGQEGNETIIFVGENYSLQERKEGTKWDGLSCVPHGNRVSE